MTSVLSLWYALSGRFVTLAYACVKRFAFLGVVIANDRSLPLFITSFLLWARRRLEG